MTVVTADADPVTMAKEANEAGRHNENASERDKSVNSEEEEKDVDKERRGQRQLRRERSPVVLKRGVRGIVKWFSGRSGFGFIRREDTDADIFVHASSIVRQTRQPLALSEHQEVEFNVVKGPKGLEAACVSGRDGKRVGLFFSQRAILARKRMMSMHDRPPRRRSDGDVDNEKQKRADDKGESGDNDKQSPTKQKANARRFHRRPRRQGPPKNAVVDEEERDDSTMTAKLPEGEEKEDGKASEEEKKEGEEEKKDKEVEKEEDEKKKEEESKEEGH